MQNIKPEDILEITSEIDYCFSLRKFVGLHLQKIVDAGYATGAIVRIENLLNKEYYIFTDENNFGYWEEGSSNTAPEIISQIKDGITVELTIQRKAYVLISVIGSDVELSKSMANVIASIVKSKFEFDSSNSTERRAIAERLLRKTNHDIRSPFFGISGFAQLIEGKTEDDEIKGYCKTMMESLGRVEIILNEIIASLGQKALITRPARFSISKMLEALVSKSVRMYARSNIEIALINNGNYYVYADKSFIKVAIYCLLSNSKEALSSGGKITFTLSEDIEKNNFILSVEDSGGGIPADIADTVFESFVTFGKDDTHLGLGLANVKKIIRAHGGVVRLNNKFGKGLEIVISLSMADKEDLA